MKAFLCDDGGGHPAAAPPTSTRSFSPCAPSNLPYTRFYAGVDLHARAAFVVVLDHQGRALFATKLPGNPAAFLQAIAPFRAGLVQQFRSAALRRGQLPTTAEAHVCWVRRFVLFHGKRYPRDQAAAGVGRVPNTSPPPIASL